MNAIGTRLRDPKNSGLTRWRIVCGISLVIIPRYEHARQGSSFKVNSSHNPKCLSISSAPIPEFGTAPPYEDLRGFAGSGGKDELW